MSKSTRLVKKNKNAWFKFFRFGKKVISEEHPRIHLKAMKEIKVSIKRKKQTEHKKIVPKDI